MEYEGQICRTPMERASFMLPVSVGCPYNACDFCDLFRHLRFRELPMEQIEAELARVSAMGGSPEKVMLGDGCAFALSTERLLDILSRVHAHFPACREVNCDATVTSILAKSDEELRRLHEAGMDTLYVGIECGLDDVLASMHKEHDMAQAARALDRLAAAGLRYGAHIMTGVAGTGRGRENALALAAFLNGHPPRFICNFSLFVSDGTPLWKRVGAGSFVPASQRETLQEEISLLQAIDVPCAFEGFNDAFEFRVRGRLPEDRATMIRRIERRIAGDPSLADRYAIARPPVKTYA